MVASKFNLTQDRPGFLLRFTSIRVFDKKNRLEVGSEAKGMHTSVRS